MRISPFRQRMIDDMSARHFGEKAQKDYIRCVKNFAAFLGRSPETADIEDLRRFRLHLIDSSLSVSSVNRPVPPLGSSGNRNVGRLTCAFVASDICACFP